MSEHRKLPKKILHRASQRRHGEKQADHLPDHALLGMTDHSPGW
jgi:hypothetical protein